MNPLCLSVRPHDNSLQTQHFSLEFSHVNELKLSVKFEDEQNRISFFSCHEYHNQTNMGLWGKK